MAVSISGTTLTFNDATTQTTAGVVFATGTALLFQQTSAPTGWTKVTTYNDYALRIVNGTASTGGSVGFTTAFASGLSAGATTLSTAQLASHSHSFSPSAFNPGGCCGPGRTWGSGYYGGGNVNAVGSNGSSSSHNHSLPSFAVQYVDVIIATKN